jgi:transposase-like protein
VIFYAPKILDKLKSIPQHSPSNTITSLRQGHIEAQSRRSMLKRLIKPTLGFKPMKTAYATIKGFEVMRMFKKSKFELWKYGQKYGQGIRREIRIITENLLAV